TLDLLAQQSQFSEARTLANKVELTGTAIVHATAAEVFWRELIADMSAAVPSGATLRQWTVQGLNVLTVAESNDALFPITEVAHAQLDVTADSLGTLRVLLDNLAERTGVIAVELGSVSVAEEGGFATVITVRF